MIKPTIRVGGFFSGIGSHVSACNRLERYADFSFIFKCEVDAKTAEADDTIHDYKIPNLSDITKVDNIGGELYVDILYWTPPCTDISGAGKLAGNDRGSGTSSSLAFEVPRIIRNTPAGERPRYLVMEEVPAMISKRFKANFDEILNELSELGYYHRYGILNSKDYGVAQSRKRCFCISKYGGEPPELPAPIPLNKCLLDYLEPEPVAPEYYLSKDRLAGLIWSNEKEREAKRGFRFEPTAGGGVAHCITSRGGGERPIISSSVITEMTPIKRKYANRGRVFAVHGCAPTISAHIAKDAEYNIRVENDR